jgi:probable F420-dependent oxidoreductase
MDIGILMYPTGRFPDIAPLAKRAEELGFESIWVPEHAIIPVNAARQGLVPDEYAYMADPFVALARASAVTTELKLGTAICLVPERNPLLLAKEVATLDMYSGGRFVFGIGAGWLESETDIMGGDFEHRWTQVKDSVLAMKELWTNTEGQYHGRYYDFPPVYSFPKPVQRPHPLVLLGGQAPNIFKRIVAWGDGWIPIPASPNEVRDGRATLDRLAESAGRDPASIQVTVDHVPAERQLIEQYADAGAGRAIVLLSTKTEDESLAELDRIAIAVL